MAKIRMPAEWEPHEATWLSWPKDPETFPDEILHKVEKIYVEMIGALHEKEKVHLLVNDERAEAHVQKMLDEAAVKSNVFIHKIKTVDVWMRDYGPIFVKDDGKVKMTKWIFNAWGEKYEELMEDNGVVDHLTPLVGSMEVIRTGIILEGGSIEVNGKGTLLTTEQCLLNPNRNHDLNRQQIEEHLKQHLGVSNIIWIKAGITGDDTDGHVDDIARFVGPKTILCAVEEHRSDENHDILGSNLETLKNARDQDGEPLEVKELPMPGEVKSPYGRLPASYANFYIGNGAVLLPVFRHKNDEKAMTILQECFPGRKIVPIYCEPLVWGLGGIHCVTQQQPL